MLTIVGLCVNFHLQKDEASLIVEWAMHWPLGMPVSNRNCFKTVSVKQDNSNRFSLRDKDLVSHRLLAPTTARYGFLHFMEKVLNSMTKYLVTLMMLIPLLQQWAYLAKTVIMAYRVCSWLRLMFAFLLWCFAWHLPDLWKLASMDETCQYPLDFSILYDLTMWHLHQ